MSISPKLLSPGEHVIASTRTHWKALVLPVFVLIVTCAVGQRGHTAGRPLGRLGRDVANLDGGYRTWAARALR